MSSTIVTIHMTRDERDKLTGFLKEKLDNYKSRQESLNIENNLINELFSDVPAGAPASYSKELISKQSEWRNKLSNALLHINKLTSFMTSINNGKTISATTEKEILSELYRRERDTARVEPHFNFYPRLKKAKEATLYEFSNKIKIFMESENVKVA